MHQNLAPKIPRVLTLFCSIFFLTTAIIVGLTAGYYRITASYFFSDLKKNEQFTVTVQKTIVEETLSAIISDLFILTKQNELILFVDEKNPNHIKAIENEFSAVAIYKKKYDQIRYLDNKGIERIRVNFNSGNITVVPQYKLQDKSNRYYFSESIVLERNEIFVSPLDLNIENGKIEQPLKPMIRFASPVFDSKDKKTGLVLLNYLANNLLESIKEAGESSKGSLMLLNSDGYWLSNQENKDDEWVFMYPNKDQVTFAKRYPDVWEGMQKNQTGQIFSKDGLFTYQVASPLKKNKFIKNNNKEYFWFIVSHLPSNMVNKHKDDLLFNYLFFGSLLIVLIGFGSWYITLTIIRKKSYEVELIEMATHDKLTSLPNRRACFEILETCVAHAKRHNRKVGVLYLDLDGFKIINDSNGHAAGDELLIQVSQRLRTISRSSDIVTRIGGDEFVCIISETNANGDLVDIAKRIIDALKKPYSLSAGIATIGASLGGAVFPDHGSDAENLLKHADKAMYESKSKGKNNFTLFT